ncbi:MAG: hypothetical protein J6D87_07640 [Clostridia bacterium]|nr:hypothetical protein [Clostridia bacterium]
MKKQNKKPIENANDTFDDSILRSKKATLVIAILSILLGGVFIFLTQAAQLDKAFIFIGAFAMAGGVFLIAYVIGKATADRTEVERRASRDKRRVRGVDDTGLRRANKGIKCKILLEKTVGDYRICYRRVKSTNELIVNGVVYDEMTALLEFAHDLSATVDGHEIHAGFDGECFSYVIFDGEKVAEKMRLI